MSYEIDSFLGKPCNLRNWNDRLDAAVVFNLTAELGLVPLTSELVRALRGQLAAGGQSKDELVQGWCIEASRGTVVAFVSASYSGGQGRQSATVWANQKLVKSNVSINSALQSLGVRAAGRDDEVDTVGLGRFRRTESWAAAERIRRLVAERRGQRGAAADDAISVLLAQATGSQGQVAIWLEAACALAKIGGKAIPALAALLVPGALPNRWHIVRALGEAGQAHRPAWPFQSSRMFSRPTMTTE